jgi:hypothetical protein
MSDEGKRIASRNAASTLNGGVTLCCAFMGEGHCAVY